MYAAIAAVTTNIAVLRRTTGDVPRPPRLILGFLAGFVGWLCAGSGARKAEGPSARHPVCVGGCFAHLAAVLIIYRKVRHARLLSG